MSSLDEATVLGWGITRRGPDKLDSCNIVVELWYSTRWNKIGGKKGGPKGKWGTQLKATQSLEVERIQQTDYTA